MLAQLALRFRISTHAPREGSDRDRKILHAHRPRFQPTLPARGATPKYGKVTPMIFDFNPRSPRGERPSVSISGPSPAIFQPTLPARGATTMVQEGNQQCFTFQPTLPARGATRRPAGRCHSLNISTHAPREGSDSGPLGLGPWGRISTHAPREGSDNTVPGDARGRRISTHAPREGSDGLRCNVWPHSWHFNPRSPRGERRARARTRVRARKFQPTLPARGATRRRRLTITTSRFQPTLPARGATRSAAQ